MRGIRDLLAIASLLVSCVAIGCAWISDSSRSVSKSVSSPLRSSSNSSAGAEDPSSTAFWLPGQRYEDSYVQPQWARWMPPAP